MNRFGAEHLVRVPALPEAEIPMLLDRSLRETRDARILLLDVNSCTGRLKGLVERQGVVAGLLPQLDKS